MRSLRQEFGGATDCFVFLGKPCLELRICIHIAIYLQAAASQEGNKQGSCQELGIAGCLLVI